MADLSTQSSEEYRELALRWHRLAAEATTSRMRKQLLDKAREYEALASGTGTVAQPQAQGERGRTLPGWRR